MKSLPHDRSHPSLTSIALPALAIGAWIAVTACATTAPPTAQVAVSTAALADAARAGGPQWAPAEMGSARDKLDHAKLAMADHDYDRADSLAQEAQVDAQLAEAKARAGIARTAAAELQQDTRVLQEEIDRKNR
jgi:hypothetical protein